MTTFTLGVNRPPPFDHVTVVAEPPIVASRVIVSPIHSVIGEFTTNVAASLIVKIISSLSGAQTPIGSSVVNVSVTKPATKSAALGVYVALKRLTSSKLPEPFEVQLAEEAVPPKEPFKVYVASEHTNPSTLASAVAGDSKVKVTSSDNAVQGPAGSSVVKVRVNVPEAISAAVGVYNAFRSVSFGVKLPLPPVHCADVAAPPIEPFNCISRFEHTGSSSPASTRTSVAITIRISSVPDKQGPAPSGSSVVAVNVKPPAPISATVGV